jgi:hypothetical protein
MVAPPSTFAAPTMAPPPSPYTEFLAAKEPSVAQALPPAPSRMMPAAAAAPPPMTQHEPSSLEVYELRRSRRQSRSPHRFYISDPRYKTSNSNTKRKHQHQQDKATQQKKITPKHATNNNNNAVTIGITSTLNKSKPTPTPRHSNSNHSVKKMAMSVPMRTMKKSAVRVLIGDDRSDDCDHMAKQRKRVEYLRGPKPTLAKNPSNNHSHSHHSTKKPVHLLQSPSDSPGRGTASSPTCTVAAAVSAANKGRMLSSSSFLDSTDVGAASSHTCSVYVGRLRGRKKEEVISSPRQNDEEEEVTDEEWAATNPEPNYEESYDNKEESYDQEVEKEKERDETKVESEFEIDDDDGDEDTESEYESEMSGEEEEEGNHADNEADCDTLGADTNKSRPSSSPKKKAINRTFKGRVTTKSLILDAQWDKHWSDIKQRHAITGSWIVLRVGHKQVSESKDNQLYNWMNGQRKAYATGKLKKNRPDRYQILKEAGFPFVISQEEIKRRRRMAMERAHGVKMNAKWQHMFAQLMEYRKRSGTWVVPRQQDDNTLFNWVHGQRKSFRRGDLQKNTPARYQTMLQAGFPFEKTQLNVRVSGPVPDENHKWNSRFEELTTHYSQYNTKIVSLHSHRELHHWAHFQVRSFRKGKMAPGRIEKLRSIGCPLDKWFFACNTAHCDIQRGVVGRGSSINSDDIVRAATDTQPMERMGPACNTEQRFQKVVDQLVKWHSMHGTWHVTETENPLLYRYVLKFTFNSNSDNATSNTTKYAQRCKSWRTPARIAKLRAVGFPIDYYLSSSSD